MPLTMDSLRAIETLLRSDADCFMDTTYQTWAPVPGWWDEPWIDSEDESTWPSVRLANIVQRLCDQGDVVRTVGDLARRTDAEWLALPSLGEKTLREIHALLARRGCTTGMRLVEVG